MAAQLAVGVFNKVLAAATGMYVEKFGMQVYNASPVFKKILDGGNKRKWTGESVRIKMVGATYKAAKSYTDFDTIDVAKSEPFTRADFEMGGYSQAVTFSGMELAKTKGNETKLFDMAKVETQVAVQSIRDLMATHLFAATNDSKGVLSLATITDATTTIGGVSGSGNWGGTTTTSGSYAAQGKTDMWTLFLTLSQYATLTGAGVSEPDLIVMNNTTGYRYYISVMESGMRYAPGEKGDVSFGSVTFMGKQVMPDPFCASGNIYMLSTPDLQVHVVSDRDMTIQQDRWAYDQDALTTPILWNGQLVCIARRTQGKLSSVTA